MFLLDQTVTFPLPANPSQLLLIFGFVLIFVVLCSEQDLKEENAMQLLLNSLLELECSPAVLCVMLCLWGFVLLGLFLHLPLPGETVPEGSCSGSRECSSLRAQALLPAWAQQQEISTQWSSAASAE